MTRAERRHRRARTKAKHLRDWQELICQPKPRQAPDDIAKRHPLDCGRAHCGICHPEKALKHPDRLIWRRTRQSA